ncbi:polysaccharide biosynthesis protein [Pseudoxanthomonas yeongjuensis]|uniref:CpsD/CapB family tyrosine-protein kinase n=1 Tax=Pseudoxanthomonas yeongjuensis TaxID=377616 RepID=UPI001391CEDD|nr:CpsD/CapB family tyrosine-protein kinase [Pseudoxanthomonas yeongjuensis]KAF1718179.1 polysaccharide biosynthesis protein [Pseudoxanthomonas yeongjuensis]
MSNPITPLHKEDTTVAGRSIAPRASTTALTPLQLEDRATIYRGESARREVDAFRELRTRLLAVVGGNAVTLIAPVSAGSGGSFVARNLAVAVAFDESKNAILVDCDLRHPSQHATMRINASAGGLIDYLEDGDGDAASVLYDTGVARLRLVPSVQSRENGSEYFSSARMRLLLDTLRTQPSTQIFLDSPPVLGSPDARILADLADVIVLVAGYGRDTPATIAQAAANFDPKKFAGVVFNEGV